MNSGPHGGFGELTLAPMQCGSKIMPGKVNPVIPEMVTQVAIKVQANDYSVCVAASRGEFELNAFLPLIADSLLESLGLLTNAVNIFRVKCIDTITANLERCKEILDGSYAFAASYITRFGYDKVAQVIRECNGDQAEIRRQLDGK
jgi:aspartate ammonia-lyase